LWTQREWTEPQVVIDRLRSVGEDARFSHERRALARYLESETRMRAGQTGEARAITEQLGFITRWLVLGPFDNEGRAGFDRASGPETGEWWLPPDASRDYDPSPTLSRITAPALFINSADDEVNPPELGMAERYAAMMPRTQFILLPITAETRGHGTHSAPNVWGGYLSAFLAALPQR
jgi:pimeloyl-ACP methyl ester carboxylesterase